MSAIDSTTPEEWRSVVDFPGYEVSNLGRVRSTGLTRWVPQRKTGVPYKVTAPPKLLKPGTHYSKGRPVCQTVYLRRDGKTYTCRIHRLVLLAFVGPCPPNMEGCHEDGDCTNNSVDNLRWDTHRANLEDAMRHGTKKLPPRAEGISHYRSVLTEQDVREIRAVPEYPGVCADLSQKYGISSGSISHVRRRNSWKHVK
jgi:hypothetical protein